MDRKQERRGKEPVYRRFQTSNLVAPEKIGGLARKIANAVAGERTKVAKIAKKGPGDEKEVT